MYMASYRGKQSRTFGVHDTPAAAKQDAEKHAQENGRLGGYYVVTEGELRLENLFSSRLGAATIRGEKHGKSIKWEG